MTDFDASLYTQAPILDLPSTITLGRTLVAACPADMPELVHRAKAKLEATVAEAGAALVERQRQAGEVSDADRRAVDLAADRAWSALRKRLEAYSELPPERHPRAAEASELYAKLFGAEGLAFLVTPYAKQLATATAMLTRIDDDGLAAALDALAGPEFLAEVRHTHAAYGPMVEANLRSSGDEAQVNLTEHRRALGRAIAAYAIKVCATVEEDLPETVARARAALRPIDALRTSSPRSSEGAARGGLETPASDGEPEEGES